MKLCQVGASPCTLPLVAKENWTLLARLQPGRHFPYLSLNCSLHREEEKTHLNPANSGIRIKAGEECYFAISGGLQGALLLQWCWDASLLMNCLCEITKHTVTKAQKKLVAAEIQLIILFPLICSYTFRLRKVRKLLKSYLGNSALVSSLSFFHSKAEKSWWLQTGLIDRCRPSLALKSRGSSFKAQWRTRYRTWIS